MMNLKISTFLMILCSVFVIIIGFFFIPSSNTISTENSKFTSDILIDFSVFEVSLEGYSTDTVTGNVKPPYEYDKSDIVEYGDPCRMEIIEKPYKINTMSFDVAKPCHIRIDRDKLLPFTALNTDMYYKNWTGAYYWTGRNNVLPDILDYSQEPTISPRYIPAGTLLKTGSGDPIEISDDSNFMEVKINFPLSDEPYELIIKPKFPIYEYDFEGIPINRAKRITELGDIEDGVNTGIIDNIEQIKDIELEIIGMNTSNRIYIVLSNEKGDLIKYFMGWLYPDTGHQVMKWSSSDYKKEDVVYMINPLPTDPNELKYVKFHSLVVESDYRNRGEHAVILVKSIKLYYDYQTDPDKLAYDITHKTFWDNMKTIGKAKRDIYEKYSQPVIRESLENCYYSSNRIEDCKYSLYW